MKHASIAQLKARLSEFLDATRGGEDVIVTDRGQPVARLTPVGGAAADSARIADLLRAGLAREPERRLPRDFLERARPRDARGSSLKAVLDERSEGW